MDKITKIIKNTNEDNQHKIDWTKAWSTKYPILKRYQNEVNISKYAKEIRNITNKEKNITFVPVLTLVNFLTVSEIFKFFIVKL